MPLLYFNAFICMQCAHKSMLELNGFISETYWGGFNGRVSRPVACTTVRHHGLYFPSCCVFISVYLVQLSSIEQKIKGNEYNLYIVQKYINEYYSYVQIYTDASKSLDNKIGVAFTVPEFHFSVRKRTSDELSVYTGEMIALLLAIQWIEEIRPLKSVICSDSCASLASLLYSHSKSRPDI